MVLTAAGLRWSGLSFSSVRPFSCKRARISFCSRWSARGMSSLALRKAAIWSPRPHFSQDRDRPHQASAQFGSIFVAVSNDRAASIQTYE